MITVNELTGYTSAINPIHVTFSKGNSEYEGFQINKNYFVSGQTYHISFHAKKTSGTLVGICGHSQNWTYINAFVDGKVFQSSYPGGADATGQNVNDGLWHRYDVYMTFNGNSDNYGFWIQPNRGNTTVTSIEVCNINAEIVNSSTLNIIQNYNKTGVIESNYILEQNSHYITLNGGLVFNSFLEI